MGEVEALKAIERGSITIPCTDNYGITTRVDLRIIKEPRGFCDNCFFNDHSEYHQCPDLARKICCTGGYILTKK